MLRDGPEDCLVDPEDVLGATVGAVDGVVGIEPVTNSCTGSGPGRNEGDVRGGRL